MNAVNAAKTVTLDEHIAQLSIWFPHRDSFEEMELTRTCPLFAELVSVRETCDYKRIRKAMQAYEGWLRDTGRVVPVEPEEVAPGIFKYSLMAQGLGGKREKHHTN